MSRISFCQLQYISIRANRPSVRPSVPRFVHECSVVIQNAKYTFFENQTKTVKQCCTTAYFPPKRRVLRKKKLNTDIFPLDMEFLRNYRLQSVLKTGHRGVKNTVQRRFVERNCTQEMCPTLQIKLLKLTDLFCFEDVGLLGCCAMLSARRLPTFQKCSPSPLSGR